MIDISRINSKLKTERRAKQAVTRGQVECAKLTKKVSALTARIDQLARDLRLAKTALAKLAPVKPSPSKPAAEKRFQTPEESARLEKIYLAKRVTQKSGNEFGKEVVS
jgi:predicted  nucleic acid-binding Zn-ribbon protein